MNEHTKRKSAAARATRRLGAVALGVALLMGGAGLAMAQASDAPDTKQRTERHPTRDFGSKKMHDKIDQRLERMTQDLELTQQQQEQIRKILTDAKQQKKALFEQKAQGDREQARAQFKALRKSTRQQIAQVLTQEQRAKLAAHRLERRERKLQKTVDRLDEKLDLTQAQREQIDAIVSEARDDLRALPEDADRSQFRAVFEQSRADIAAVLDEEQRVKYEAMKQKMRKRHKRHDKGQ